MQPAEVLDLLNEWEEHLPVAEWTANGVRIWPLVRIGIPTTVLDRYIEMSQSAHRSRGGQVADIATGLLRPLFAELRDRAHRARTGARFDVVIFGDGVSKTKIEETWFDRLCDPFHEAIARRGLTSLQLEPGTRPRLPRRVPSRFVQPWVDVAYLRSRGATPQEEALDLPGLEQVAAAMARHSPDAAPLTAEGIARKARQLRVLAARFEHLLDTAQPSVGFVVDYLVPNLAFNLACARRGIESVEIQHGAIGPEHPVYARWGAVPSDGYDLLPSAYWVWSDVDAAVIESWSAATQPRHRAIAGGNLWLESWRSDDSDVVRQLDQQLREARRRAPGERHVLVALATGSNSAVHLEPFVASMKARPTWRWWIRHHPTMGTAERSAATRILSAVPDACLELESSDLPLHAVLRHVDAVTTRGSAVVTEAALLGVPSILVDRDLAVQYRAEIESGWVAVGADAPAEMLERQMDRATTLPPYAPPKLAPDDALDLLLPATTGAPEASG